MNHSGVGSLLPFYRPAACLEAHPAGVPGNCHLLASLSIKPPGSRHQDTALDKVLTKLSKATSGQQLQLQCHCLIDQYTLIAVSVRVGALVDQQINLRAYISCSSSCLPFVGMRLVSCHSAVWLCLLISNAVNKLVCQFLFHFI